MEEEHQEINFFVVMLREGAYFLFLYFSGIRSQKRYHFVRYLYLGHQSRHFPFRGQRQPYKTNIKLAGIGTS